MRITLFCLSLTLGLLTLACGGGSGEGGPRCKRGAHCSPELPNVPGDPDTTVETALPSVPRMVNVRATVTGDAVDIHFDPIDGARDYRVYELPSDDRITSDSEGHVTIQDGLSRCAGDQQSPAPMIDDGPSIQSNAIRTIVEDAEVEGYERTLADATLGYVFATPGPGRIPVYAMGDSGPNADNSCYFARWTSTRVKRYVTDEAEREALLAERWRDDGIVFYVPTESATTIPVRAEKVNNSHLVYVDGAEGGLRGPGTVLFHVLAAPEEGTQPLMRVYMRNDCGQSHDELAPGVSRFDRIRYQGDQIPEHHLHWSGITKETVLVVEALFEGCPYQGLLQPKAVPASETQWDWSYGPWLTLDQIRAASATGEVFINGQHAHVGAPRPVARSFVRVSPAPTAELDFYAGFGPDESMGEFEEVDCGLENCWAQHRFVSPQYDILFTSVEPERYAFTPMLGELWVGYSDVGADVDGKIRITPTVPATMSSNTFLYVTMEVNAFTTGRRYPQIMISDRPVPVQHTMKDGNTLVVQTFRDWPPTFEVQVCDHETWNVNDQCPSFDLHEIEDGDGDVIGLFPGAEVGEHTGLDRTTRLEVYASTERVYLFLDGEPHGCMLMPNSGVPSGTATVTFGDVLYHSGVDHLYTFTEQAFQTDTQRHFDNLGYRSGVAEPEWDENRFPCVSRMFQQ